MSEFRQDKTSGAWVIIAPERGRRPRQWRNHESESQAVPPFDPACPFCPGNEHLLPRIIDEMARDEPPGWSTRVVGNKYPALRSGVGQAPPADPAGVVKPGYGCHEVIIETGRHDADLVTLSDTELCAILRTYRRRYVALTARPGIKAVIVFRNHGRRAGASLVHPHSQTIAVGMVPPRLSEMTAWARSYYAREGRCATCDELEREIADGSRIVEATERFLVVVPFAAAAPFELWILPRRHQPSFAESDEDELAELGYVLRRVLYRLKLALDDPPYNYAIEAGATEDADTPFMHWRLRIAPDLVTPGGFELSAGLPINPSRPEEDAEILRAVSLPIDGKVK